MTLEATEARQALLQRVVTEVNAVNITNQQYAAAKLFPPDINPQPILYFGNPLTAEFATFGVNPAAGELTWSRWPNPTMTVQQLDIRCVEYFKTPTVPPNDWFDDYEKPLNSLGPDKALNFLGHSYRTDTVHLDFSPRATVPRTTASKKLTKPNYNIFVQHLRQMVVSDLQWFLSALALCRNVKAAIMAGSVTNANRDYLDKFLQAHLPSHSLTLRQPLGVKGDSGPPTALYDLVGPGLSIPVFFVSRGPSLDHGTKVAREVRRNLCILKKAGFIK